MIRGINPQSKPVLKQVLSIGITFGMCLPIAWAQQPNVDSIRVAVSQEDSQVELQVKGLFSIVTANTGRTLHEGRRLHRLKIQGTSQGIALGEKQLPILGIRIEPKREDTTISLNGRPLRGALEITRREDLTLRVINTVALEDYLRGVLSREAPDYWPIEALKAIAIAARTYALFQRVTKAEQDYDVTGDVMSQDYGGKTSEKAATTRAVQQTAGLILLYQGRLFPTFYHSTCGGMTEHARVMGPFDVQPLKGGVSCSLCYASPFYSWQRRLSRADIGWALHKSSYGSIGPIQDLQVTRRTPSGRAQQITITGKSRTLLLSGFEFRSLFGFDHIRSPLFSITPVEDAFVLDGHGWGHGVGLCQWGALELARRGFSAAEILVFYYRGADVVSLKDLKDQPITAIIQGGKSN